MIFRLAAGCCVVGTLAVLSPVRQGALVPALPDTMLGSLTGGVAGSLAPQPVPADAGPASQALTDLIVRQAVAQGTAEIREKLATVLNPVARHGEPARSRDTLTVQDRMPGWRGPSPKS